MCGREGIFPWSSDGRRRILSSSSLERDAMVRCVQAGRLENSRPTRRRSVRRTTTTIPQRLATVTCAANECRSASVRGCAADDRDEYEAEFDAARGDEFGEGDSRTVALGATEEAESIDGRTSAVPSAFFDEMDELEDAIYAAKESLAEAVAREAYEEAAALAATCASLEARDTTLAIERAFEAAVQEERYSDAARLRDEGGRRMLGWWVGREGADDMVGHLVEVRRGVGRYVGVALDPNCSNSSGVGGVEGGGGVGPFGEVGVGENELFEVFFDARTGGEEEGVRFVSQATVFDGRVVFAGDLEEEDLFAGGEDDGDDGDDGDD